MSDRAVALVTGARKGIGRALVDHLLETGWIVAGCSREPVALTHERFVAFQGDVADEAFVKSMIGAIQRDHGRIDAVINNAGIAAMNHALLTPAATSDRIFSTNFKGAFLVSREAAKAMRKHRYGRIVNLGTVAVPLRLEGELVYAASKAAVISMTQILAKELAEFGITVNAIGPTPIETDLIRAVPKEKIDKITQSLAIKRLGTFADVHNVVDFFLRPESGYVTGQTIYLGGVS